MLNYRTLDYKPTQHRDTDSGVTVYFKDLLTKTWEEWPDVYTAPVLVNKYYVARPDLISLAMYGTDEYADIICKFNGISNPFELNEGMVLYIPPSTWVRHFTSARETAPCDLIQTGETIEQKDTLKRLRTDARSSSTATVGDSAPYIIDKTLGMVFY